MLLAVILRCIVLVCMIGQYKAYMNYKKFPAPDGHRCGICPTYYQKICGFDFNTNQTYIFDNHCIMDLFNCIEGKNFETMNYEECLFFGNFAYVYGMKKEDEDYDEDIIKVIGAKKNPPFPYVT